MCSALLNLATEQQSGVLCMWLGSLCRLPGAVNSKKRPLASGPPGSDEYEVGRVLGRMLRQLENEERREQYDVQQVSQSLMSSCFLFLF